MPRTADNFDSAKHMSHAFTHTLQAETALDRLPQLEARPIVFDCQFEELSIRVNAYFDLIG